MVDSPLAVVLAAGRGTRMRSELPKLLHPLGGRPILLHVLDAARAVTGRPPLVVVSPDQPAVRGAVGELGVPVDQAEPRGSGHALRSVPPDLRTEGLVLVLNGDVPLVRQQTLQRVIDGHGAGESAITIVSAVPPDPRGLGRIVRDNRGRVERIVEERDLPAGQPIPAECNAGIYAIDGARLWAALEHLSADNAAAEFYVTDLVALMGPAAAIAVEDPGEIIGINDRVQLASAEAELRHRVLRRLMESGVTIEDPATTYVEAGVSVGSDSVIRPMTVLRGATVIGHGCEIGPMAQLQDVRCGDRVRIGSSTLTSCTLEDGVVVGQYCRVRPGSTLGRDVYLGTHAEVKNSSVGARTHISHFGCVLDSDVGVDVNVSAGAVTCNYDGFSKNRTVIGDGAFVGSATMLVAPVAVGAGAYTAAGSVITREVPAGALGVERSPQREIEGWVERRRAQVTRIGAAPPAEATPPGDVPPAERAS